MIELHGGLRRVKDLALALPWLEMLLWCGSNPWPWNFYMRGCRKKKKYTHTHELSCTLNTLKELSIIFPPPLRWK